jgi:hypothetical protein
MTFCLTVDQQAVLDHLSVFIRTSIDIHNSDTYLATMSGSAGTGKTTLTKEIIKMIRKSGRQVLCVAPTHKARRVLSAIINTSSFLRIPTTTIAGFLGKIRAHGYVGTQNYMKGLDTKIGMYDFFVIDEISMVTSSDYKEICNLAQTYQKKILFIGDQLQIPHPAQGYSVSPDGKYLRKNINPAFSEPYQLQLTQIVRNIQSNPLVPLLSTIRDAVGQGFLVKNLTDNEKNIHDGMGYMLMDNHISFIEKIRTCAEHFKTGQYRIVSYTNNSVYQYNKIVRDALKYTESLVVGEILTGYNNVGPNNDLMIENGQDYTIGAIKYVTDHTVYANGQTYSNLSGHIVTIKELMDEAVIETNIFLLDLNESVNCKILEELIHLASLVNMKNSTKHDYRNYIAIKSNLIFMEDLYKYKDCVYTGSEFKQMHPLLFSNTTDVLTMERIPTETELTNKIKATYPSILSERISDNKDISGTELLSDRYQILEKDISYGYALTAHKSQGSTYHTVFMDETDFNCLRDGWSWKKNMKIDRSHERDRLKYVALSRASHICYIHVAQT